MVVNFQIFDAVFFRLVCRFGILAASFITRDRWLRGVAGPLLGPGTAFAPRGFAQDNHLP
jgi:hypothetical protein